MKAVIALGVALLFATAAQADTSKDPDRGPARFNEWAASHSERISAFQRYLQRRDVGEVVPMWQLLRTATDWQRCGAEPFGIAPEPQWPAVADTLDLLKALKTQRVLGEFEVASAWRDETLNRCAGGSTRSAHVRSFAVDLLPGGSVDGLCRFWKEQGQAWRMGLSRYPSGRVHLDTAGYRTWGEDYSQRTSFCR